MGRHLSVRAVGTLLAHAAAVIALAGCAAAPRADADMGPAPLPLALPAPSAEVIHALAPTGVLRASINVGNPVLASLDPATGQPVGVSVDLAADLARRLHVPLQLIVAQRAADSVANLDDGRADLGFLAIDPKRAGTIRFTPPYVTIEGAYLVRDASPIAANAQVDRPGVKVAVSRGSAYDLYLSRTLRQATVVRLPLTPPIAEAFQAQHLDVAAGVRPQLEQQAAALGGLRVLDGHFMEIRQALGVPQARGAEAGAYLTRFVGDAIASGQVAASLARHRIGGAQVAPPAATVP